MNKLQLQCFLLAGKMLRMRQSLKNGQRCMTSFRVLRKRNQNLCKCMAFTVLQFNILSCNSRLLFLWGLLATNIMILDL